jgi:hypothetical protein
MFSALFSEVKEAFWHLKHYAREQKKTKASWSAPFNPVALEGENLCILAPTEIPQCKT